MPDWLAYLLVALVFLGLVVQVSLLLNVHRILSRVSAIRRDVDSTRNAGTGPQLAEAVAQLQSVAVSLDRIALRCDTIERRVGEIAERGPAGQANDVGVVAAAIREAVGALQAPVAEIRDRLARGELDRLGDEVRRTLYLRGYDGVTVLTDLEQVPRAGELRVQVEVVREGVKSKGYVLVRDGAAVEAKISPTYEMFP